jgi:hypothetical protein
MRARALAILWACVGVAIWLGVFDLYVSRGAREYGQDHAEFELHMRPFEPSMSAVMDYAKHEGVVAATLWAVTITGLGWLTIWLKTTTHANRHSRGSL